jgi:TM2 domain-containing membrane protein YozV
MSQERSVYDLGSVDLSATRDPAPEAARAAQPAAPPHESRTVVNPRRMRPIAAVPAPAFDVCGSLSIFVPGSGQILRGEIALGLFFLVTVAFFGTLVWAIVGTLDRLSATLSLMGQSPAAAAWMLGALFAAGGLVHLTCVLNAGSNGARAPNPAFAAVASLLVPGWGQILNGDRYRAALFLFLLWVVAAGWILVSPPAHSVLAELGLYLPVWAKVLSTPIVRWTLPAIVWTLSVYDAASRSAHRR